MANNVIGSIPYSLGKAPLTPGDPESEMGIRAIAQVRETIDLRTLAKHIREHGSSFSVGTLYGVLADMVACTVELLRSGYSVDFDGLGRFYNSLQSKVLELKEGDDASNVYTASNIEHVNIRCAISDEAEAALNTDTEFEYVMTRKEQAAAKKAAKQALGLTDGGTTNGNGNDNGNDDGGDGVTE